MDVCSDPERMPRDLSTLTEALAGFRWLARGSAQRAGVAATSRTSTDLPEKTSKQESGARMR
jgi:hypothetical protein